MSQRDFNDLLDDINSAEQRKHRQMGFTRGYSMGEEAGWRAGYSMGIRKGAQIAAEIGFYQGYVHAWIAILEREEGQKARKLSALRALLDMTRSFPKSNQIASLTTPEEEDDLNLKLTRIRAKFKQVSALLNTSAAQSDSMGSRSSGMGGAGVGGNGYHAPRAGGMAAHLRRSFAASGSGVSFLSASQDGSYAGSTTGGGPTHGPRTGSFQGTGSAGSAHGLGLGSHGQRQPPSRGGSGHLSRSMSHEMSF